RSRTDLRCSPNLRSTTTVSNFRVFTKRMAFGISVQTSVEAANSWRDWESCSIVGGSRETRSARTADSGELRFEFMAPTDMTASWGLSFCWKFWWGLSRFVTKTEQGGCWLPTEPFFGQMSAAVFTGYPRATPSLVLISEQLCTYRECTASFLLYACRCGFAPRCSVVAWNADVGNGSWSIADAHSA